MATVILRTLYRVPENLISRKARNGRIGVTGRDRPANGKPQKKKWFESKEAMRARYNGQEERYSYRPSADRRFDSNRSF